MTSWLFLLIGLGVQIVVETIILTLSLWIMIKVQKLNYNVPGLLGTAALTSAVDEISTLVLSHFLGGYLASYVSTPIVVVVLAVCIHKLTEADPVDVTFTIVVGYAVWFCLNLFFFAALMGDLSPSARYAEEDHNAMEPEAEYQAVETNRPAPPALKTNKVAGNVAPPTKPAIPSASAGDTDNPAPANSANVSARGLTLKGIIGGAKPSAMIATGVRTYTFFEGDFLTVDTAEGKVDVRCEKLETNRVLLNVAGESLTLSLPGAK